MILFLKNLLFTLLVPGVVAVVVPLTIAAKPLFVFRLTTVPALFLLIIGAAVYIWCVWDFATFGRGTPAPIDAPKRLVVHGLYHYTRNPMYLAGLLVILGWATHFFDPWLLLYGCGIAACFHLFVVLYEEPHLQHLFGADYDGYRSAVNRWLPSMRNIKKV